MHHIPSLQQALQLANQAAITLSASLSTGFPALDQLLPGGGWPTNCVIEVLSQDGRIDPLTLLLPALATLSWKRRWIAWVAPSHLPVARDLSEQGFDPSRVLIVHRSSRRTSARIATQALTSGVCGAVLMWSDSIEQFQIAQLQQAAQRGRAIGFLFRPATAVAQPSPAELRIYATTHSQRLGLEILQCRGGPGAALQLERDVANPLFRPDRYWLPQPGSRSVSSSRFPPPSREPHFIDRSSIYVKS